MSVRIQIGVVCLGFFILGAFFPLAAEPGANLASLEESGKVSTKPLILKQGGTAEQPFVYDGKGITIDLGLDVTDHAWVKNGDVWTSSGPVAGAKPIAPGQTTALFVDDMPIRLASLKGLYGPAEELQPGRMGVLADGSLYFKWPTGKVPGQSKIYALPKLQASCVTIAASYITVKNITATHANNDGFNIHGDFVGIRLENIKAISNGDEGISAHDNVQMEVDGAEIAWNGSFDAGVADVNRSKTNYRNCVAHDNVGIAAFKFFGAEHHITDTVIYNQAKDFTIGPETIFTQERVSRPPGSPVAP